MKKLTIFTLSIIFTIALGLVASASGPVHWNYEEGEEGPDHWGELSHDFEACSTGTEQSPIDIPASASVNPADIVFNYQPSALKIENNGHTIKASYDAGSTIEVNGKTFNLLQFHFHALSEHTINGAPSPLEAHFVHQSDDGEFAVVGVMMNRGAENAALTPVWDNMPAEEGDPITVSGATINAAELLPSDRSYYRYNGSFTTPPCTESVNWLFMTTPIELSDGQATAFEQLYDHNYRPVQPFNDRAFLQSSELGVVTLPETGGQPFPWGATLLGLGGAIVGTGLFIRFRKEMA